MENYAHLKRNLNLNGPKPTYDGIPVWRGLRRGLFPRGFHVNGQILLRNNLYDNFARGDVGVEEEAMLEHERAHIIGREWGLRNTVRHFAKMYNPLNREPMRDEELGRAIPAEMKVYKDHGERFPIEQRARDLSGPTYLWCIRYKDAVQRLSEIEEELK